MGSTDPAGDFESLSRAEPQRAVDEAEAYLEAHRTGDGDLAVEAAMLRNAALAARAVRDLDLSNRYASAATATADRAGHSAHRTRAQLTLAYNYFLAGERDRAVDLVMSLDGGSDDLLQAQVGMQQATILGRMARSEEAIAALTSALEFVRRTDDRYVESQILKNRGMFNARIGAYEAAIEDTMAAHGLCQSLELDFEAAFCTHNVGLAASYVGDLPRAFGAFEEAERQIRALAGSDFESKAGHCRALISAGLFHEAAAMAASAADRCDRAGFLLDGAETRMLEARAWLEADEVERAQAAAAGAASAFADQGRPGWRAAADLIALECRHRGGMSAAADEVRDLVAELEALGLQRESLSARLLLAEVQTSAGDTAGAAATIDAAAEAIAGQSVDLRLAEITIRAELERSTGRFEDALLTARLGHRLLSEEQTVLASSDLRVGARQHARRLGELGLSTAVASGDAQSIMEWMELIGVSRATPRQVRPPADQTLRAAHAKLRSLEPDEGARRQELEERIRLLHRSARADNGPAAGQEPLDLSALADADAVLLERTGDSLLGCSVVDGQPTVRDLGEPAPIERMIRGLRSDLRLLAVAPQRAKPARIRAALERLDQLLLGDVRDRARPLVVTGDPDMLAVPWNALPSRVGVATTVAPSLTGWVRSASTNRANGAAPWVLAAGPDLDVADHELTVLSELRPDAAALARTDASADRLLTALDGAAGAHLIAHGSIRSDNPLFSSFRLVDGDVSVYELDDLSAPPDMVVLSACHLGLSSSAPGRELLGMATGLLAIGTSTVIASTLPVADDRRTVDLMTGLHRALLDDDRPAEAWARVQRNADDEARLDAAAFTVFGRGW